MNSEDRAYSPEATEERTLESKHARKVEALQSALEISETARKELLASNSWRMTAPIRWLRRRLGESRNSAVAVPVSPEQGRGVAAFPATLRAVAGDRPDGANDTYHPLDLDGALTPLLPLDVTSGRLETDGQPDIGLYLGSAVPCLRIAFIGSEELRNELAFDAAVTPLTRDGWPAQLRAVPHDLLMLETAWHPPGGWEYGLIGVGEEAETSRELVHQARDIGLPVVLWLREDPANVCRYASLIAQVDIVYAIDELVAARVRQEFPQARVELLPPAIQPALHNPVRSYRLRDAAQRLEEKILLDGWWDLGERTAGHDELAALKSQLLVTESEWDVSRVRIPDLPQFQESTIGCVTPLEKSALSRIVPAELFLEKSLLPDWRRDLMMRRAAACGALVLREGQSPVGLDPDLSVSVEQSQPSGFVQSLLRDRIGRARRAHLAFREVVSNHCVADRLAVIAGHLGLPAASQVVAGPEKVAVILVTMRPERLERCLEWFRRDRYENKELVVLLHGGADVAAASRLGLPGEPVRFLQLGRDRSLGDCLNFAAAHTDAPYWVKMDDDDHYGSNYLSDLMLYRRVSSAPVFGKPPMFLHLEEGDELRWDPVWAQHANLLHSAGQATSALIAGGTLGGRREVLDEVRFSGVRRGGSDSDFIRRCYERGYDVLATDGFNFARFRSADQRFHTWQAPVTELKERALAIGSGTDLESLAFI